LSVGCPLTLASIYGVEARRVEVTRWLSNESSLSIWEKTDRATCDAIYKAVPDAVSSMFGSMPNIDVFFVAPQPLNQTAEYKHDFRTIYLSPSVDSWLARWGTPEVNRRIGITMDYTRDAIHAVLHESIHALSATGPYSHRGDVHLLNEGFTEFTACEFLDEFADTISASLLSIDFDPGVRLATVEPGYPPFVEAAKEMINVLCEVAGGNSHEHLRSMARCGYAKQSDGMQIYAETFLDGAGVPEAAFTKREKLSRKIENALIYPLSRIEDSWGRLRVYERSLYDESWEEKPDSERQIEGVSATYKALHSPLSWENGMTTGQGTLDSIVVETKEALSCIRPLLLDIIREDSTMSKHDSKAETSKPRRLFPFRRNHAA
jgi:hypothetical protein